MLLRLPPWKTFRWRCVSVLDVLWTLLSVAKAVRVNLQEALKTASGNGSEADKTEARIEADVYESLQHALAPK